MDCDYLKDIDIIWYSFKNQCDYIDGNQYACQSITDSGVQKIVFKDSRRPDDYCYKPPKLIVTIAN
jgi:hypothetical protein